MTRLDSEQVHLCTGPRSFYYSGAIERREITPLIYSGKIGCHIVHLNELFLQFRVQLEICFAWVIRVIRGEVFTKIQI